MEISKPTSKYTKTLFELGTVGYVILIESPSQQTQLSHDTVLAAAKILRDNSKLTLEVIQEVVQRDLIPGCSPRELDFLMRIAVQAMFMIDPNVKDAHGRDFTIRTYRHVSQLAQGGHCRLRDKMFPSGLSRESEPSCLGS
ncbi:uncharacterized protein B0T15DRAFT_117633 [Chaetomium strumarium]|uniref:Uncharacterized protein n=1 Tax=Chaetomium strumarium TaxID=1170767 RepID=A0AAJ0GZ00_9PEZI|nr:hypothetical protein B0T15DRAFT_117633 [Chaetomium strumarium]